MLILIGVFSQSESSNEIIPKLGLSDIRTRFSHKVLVLHVDSILKDIFKRRIYN
jgi:hypothetical protein